ncbi:hypothetical protein Ahu01nite_013920 [Winogradskya humida]|uniref:3-keto-5-aminohexanoate cleavage enzyme n=2 Tax=Winogradskya humida TaxID=113566 RepID=A0ABQ3ZI81_9ACTN|nr:hypothetical protein Ahu01nite_013920 [Actinoplanes humidus]
MKACLNGGRAAGVPMRPGELALDAAAAVAAGAEAVHIHPRDAAGAETLDAVAVGATVKAVKERCPGTPVGVTTGLWITDGSPTVRLERLRAWADLPEASRPSFASVNLGEGMFHETVAVLEGAGVATEAGVWSRADVELLQGVPVEKVLIEVLRTPAAEAMSVADLILERLEQLGVAGPRLLHGEDEACWPLIRYAGRLGLPTRIGLEDTLADETGAPARSNAGLVKRAIAVWEGERHRPRT